MNVIAYIVAFVHACLVSVILFGLLFRDARLVARDGSRIVAPLIGLAIFAGMTCLVAVQYLRL